MESKGGKPSLTLDSTRRPLAVPSGSTRRCAVVYGEGVDEALAKMKEGTPRRKLIEELMGQAYRVLHAAEPDPAACLGVVRALQAIARCRGKPDDHLVSLALMLAGQLYALRCAGSLGPSSARIALDIAWP